MPSDTPYAGVAAIFKSALAAGAPPCVFEDGHQLRDFVHVRDVARVNVLALTAKEPVTGALNVASGSPPSFGEMDGAMADASGLGAPRPVTTGEFRLGDVRHVFASVRRAERVLASGRVRSSTRGCRSSRVRRCEPPEKSSGAVLPTFLVVGRAAQARQAHRVRQP